MKSTVIHRLNDSIELRYQDQSLFTYVYKPDMPTLESPKPYFHPLKTLAGNVVSLFRPYDHRWHSGLSFSVANLAGENFWGGATYTREVGYVQLDNNGSIQHSAWQEIACEDDKVRCVEYLKWVTQSGVTWIEEERHIGVSDIRPEAGYWCLDMTFALLNVAQQALVFGSPTTEGRPGAGYGGLFWRGPRSFLHGKILGAEGLEGPEMMGQHSTWLALSGWHDGNCEQSTLLFIDRPENPRYPNKWFVRNEPYACVSCSCMFDEYYILPVGEILRLAYRVVFGNGEWSRARIEAYVATCL